MGVLQKFRAGSDVAVAEFVQTPMKFLYGSASNTSQGLSGAVASETEGRVKHLFTGIRFPGGEFKISKMVFPPSLPLQVQMKAEFAEVPLAGPVRALSTESAPSAQNMV